jgi:hypothetical protein
MSKIIVHGSEAHPDDFYSTCLALSKDGTVEEIERKDPSKEELEDASIWKLDVGKVFDPNIMAFDHHIKDWEECSLSLLLHEWNIWEISCKVHGWIVPLVLNDSKGPTYTSTKLELSKKAMVMLDSFAERVLIEQFESVNQLKRGDTLFELMKKIGDRFFSSIREYSDAADFITENSTVRSIKGISVYQCLKDKPETISGNMMTRVFSEKKKEFCGYGGIGIFRSNRPKGSISVKRFDDDSRVDFSPLKVGDGVIFAHATGFYLVLKNMCEYEMDQIISEGIKK